MDAFFASVEQLDNPHLAGLPVVVANSPLSPLQIREMAEAARNGPPAEFIRGMRGVVASASYAARAFGVRSAMPLARALVLCPHAIVLPGRFGRYEEVADRLRAIWGEFSPVVEPMSLDEAYLDLSGWELSAGSIRQVAEQLKARIRSDTGLTASVGVGSSKLVAKIASDLDKPDGLVIVYYGQEAGTLAPLSVRALPGVGPRTAEALDTLGIKTCGDLARAQPEALARVFGMEQAASLKRRAVGIDGTPVQPPGDPKSISKETTLAEDSYDLDHLRGLLRDLSERVAWTLRREGFMARCIYIKLRLLPRKRAWRPEGSGFAKPITRQCTLTMATDAGQEIYVAAARLLTEAAQSTGLGSGQKVVRLIGVGASSLAHTEDVVLRLPGKNSPDPRPPAATALGEHALQDRERLRRLNYSLDRIRERYGFSSIRQGTTRAAEDGT
jgi:DNA polymerase-4